MQQPFASRGSFLQIAQLPLLILIPSETYYANNCCLKGKSVHFNRALSVKVLEQHEEADREAAEALDKTDGTKLWHQISGSISASSVALVRHICCIVPHLLIAGGGTGRPVL